MDGHTEFSSLDRVCIPCSTVKSKVIQNDASDNERMMCPDFYAIMNEWQNKLNTRWTARSLQWLIQKHMQGNRIYLSRNLNDGSPPARYIWLFKLANTAWNTFPLTICIYTSIHQVLPRRKTVILFHNNDAFTDIQWQSHDIQYNYCKCLDLWTLWAMQDNTTSKHQKNIGKAKV